MWHPLRSLLKFWRTLVRSSVIGIIIGIIPGPGCVAASFFAYDREKRASKTPEKFGTGVPEGVVATESANNAVVGGSLVPLLALGVPGNSVSALFLGALLLHGLRPGPALFRGSPEVAYGMLMAMFLANIVMAPFGLLVGRGFSYFLKVPAGIMRALILAICMVGTFSLRNNVGDIYIMTGFGLLAYFMKKLDVPVSPLVLGLILGPLIERSFHQAWTIYDGNMSFLVTRPISLVLMLLALWSLASGIRRSISSRSARPKAPGVDAAARGRAG
jgi:putative tricarboxylic transport membrane protein